MRLSSLRGLIPLALLLGLWELLGDPHSPTTPAPSGWWPAFKAVETGGTLWPAVGKTIALFAESLAIAIVLGVVLGIALGSSRLVTRALGPLLEFLRTTPSAAIVPAALLLFGPKTQTNIGVVVWGTIWPIMLNTATARASLPVLRLEVADSLRLTRWEQMRKIVLPSLVPGIVVGVRVAAPICFIITLLADFLMSTGGLGLLLVQAQQAFEGATAFALLAFIGVLGFVINLTIGGAERVALRRWPAAGP